MKRVAQGFATENVSPKLAPALHGQSLPVDLIEFSAIFVDLQQARHEADYDTARQFTRQEVLDHLAQAEQAFEQWKEIRRTLPADVFLVGLLAQSQMRI